jgi:hypothetical protein
VVRNEDSNLEFVVVDLLRRVLLGFFVYFRGGEAISA